MPQSVLLFGGAGVARNDPDFMAAFVVNHILANGSSSRLYQELREKHGLVYAVSESLLWLEHASVLLGDTVRCSTCRTNSPGTTTVSPAQ